MPPQLLAAAITLQALHGLSDFETVQELQCDLRWKAACGIGLHDMASDPSLPAYFRRRLSRSARPNRVFEAVREVVKATGVLKGKHRRALDSTVLDDAVATQDTVTQLIAAVRAVIREVPGVGEVAAVQCTAHDYNDPGKPRIAWNDGLGAGPEAREGRGRPRGSPGHVRRVRQRTDPHRGSRRRPPLVRRRGGRGNDLSSSRAVRPCHGRCPAPHPGKPFLPLPAAATSSSQPSQQPHEPTALAPARMLATLTASAYDFRSYTFNVPSHCP